MAMRVEENAGFNVVKGLFSGASSGESQPNIFTSVDDLLVFKP